MTSASAEESATEGPPDKKALHAVVDGRVQGVGFRNFTKVNAQRAEVAGWVRNLDDGTVEIWAEGSKPDLQRLLKAIKRGPTHSHVSDVNLTWDEPTGDYRSFHIRC